MLDMSHRAHHPWWPLLGLLSWCLIFMSSYCNSFEDRAPVDFIYRCLDLQMNCWDLTSWLVTGYHNSSHSNKTFWKFSICFYTGSYGIFSYGTWCGTKPVFNHSLVNDNNILFPCCLVLSSGINVLWQCLYGCTIFILFLWLLIYCMKYNIISGIDCFWPGSSC